jgi:hypothetical protein
MTSSAFPRKGHVHRWIAVKNLAVVWPTTQRHKKGHREGSKRRFIKYLTENFDPNQFGSITVSQPNKDGIHHVIDGMHRVEAIRIMYGGEEKVPCIITEVQSEKDAAEGFLGNNTVVPVQAIERFMIAVVAEHETQVEINNIVEAVGLKVDPSSQDGCIAAVQALEALHRKYGPEAVEKTLLVLQGIWGNDRSAFDAVIVRGAGEFLAKYDGQINQKRLITKIGSKFTPDRIKGQGKAAQSVLGGSLANAISAVMTQTYNSGLRKGQLETA